MAPPKATIPTQRGLTPAEKAQADNSGCYGEQNQGSESARNNRSIHWQRGGRKGPESDRSGGRPIALESAAHVLARDAVGPCVIFRCLARPAGIRAKLQEDELPIPWRAADETPWDKKFNGGILCSAVRTATVRRCTPGKRIGPGSPRASLRSSAFCACTYIGLGLASRIGALLDLQAGERHSAWVALGCCIDAVVGIVSRSQGYARCGLLATGELSVIPGFQQVQAVAIGVSAEFSDIGTRRALFVICPPGLPGMLCRPNR